MKSTITILLALVSFTFLTAQTYYPTSHCGEVVAHTYYTLSYCEDHEQAEWVYYKLTPSMTYGSVDRTDNFRADPKVKTGSAALEDYKGSGYDRGHLAPAGDMTMSKTAMSESFYMSNMSPQDPSFNRGGWKNLEALFRSWAQGEEIIIVTGPILDENISSAIGMNQVTVPKAYYKIAYSLGSEKMIGFIMPNSKVTHELSHYTVNIDKVESVTGIDFFPQLEDTLEESLESALDISKWSFSSTASTSSTSSKNGDDLYPKNTASTRCLGFAKSTGAQCKNKTLNSNGYCHVHQDQSAGYVKPKTSSGSSGQCSATTQAGTRCKRSAASRSSYCWQHQ